MTPSNRERAEALASTAMIHGQRLSLTALIDIFERAIDAAVADATAELRAALHEASGRFYSYRQRCQCRDKMRGACPSCCTTRTLEEHIHALAARTPDGDAK